MENKTVEENNDIQIDLIIADWMDREATGNSQVYMAELNMIRGAIKEYASLQCAEMKEERDKAIAAYNSACQRIDDKQALNDSLEDRVDGLNNKYADAVAVAEKQHTAIKQLQEEVERLKSENQDYVGKVTFYRVEVERLRQYAERNKIGKPNQKLFDALYDHIIDLKNEKDYWENHHRVLETEAIAREVIEICKAHADDGHFDYDGALANTMRIYEAKYDSSKESKPS